ncbi:MAG TPA: hypothetical protein ENK57_12115 [Polyangiaceae bacterium]|nr:hypothetical protein [Polyangiaceae bacterium]
MAGVEEPPVVHRGVRSGKLDENGTPLGDHRCTPPEIWSVALEALGAKTFDLDAATNDFATIPAIVRCTGPKVGGADGLAVPWWGNVWLNFPFSTPNPWIAKVGSEADRMLQPVLRMNESLPPSELPPRSITVLGPGDSAVAWWRAMRQTCDAWAMWPKRAHFPRPDQPKGSAPGPVHLWYIGPRATRWRTIMESHGVPTSTGALP